MSEWIALRIIDTKEKDGVEAARKKYILYFLLTNKMECYKEKTDLVLVNKGYSDCIVTE